MSTPQPQPQPQGPESNPWVHCVSTDQFHPARLQAYGEGLVEQQLVFAMVIKNPQGPETFQFFLDARDTQELHKGLSRTLAGWN